MLGGCGGGCWVLGKGASRLHHDVEGCDCDDRKQTNRNESGGPAGVEGGGEGDGEESD